MSPQAGFILLNEIIPRLRSAIPNAVRFVGCEDAEELIQDGACIAARLLHSVEQRGKQVTAGNIVHFTIQHLRSGRRSTGQRKNDPLDPMAQLNGNCSLVSLDAPPATETDGEDIMCRHDVLAAQAEDPATAATRRLDWAPLVASLAGPVKAVLQCLVEGEDLTTLVPRLKRSRSSLQNDKQSLARLAIEHLGEDVLARVQDQPRWRDTVAATRERLACRYARSLV